MAPPENHLSRWAGEFLDGESEEAFQEDVWPRVSRQLRFIAIMAGSLYALMIYLNWKGFGEGVAFRTMLAFRVGTGLAFWGIAVASRPSWPRRRIHALFLITILCMVATRLVENHLTAWHIPSGHPPITQVFPVMPLILFVILAIPMRLVLLWSGVGALLLLQNQARLSGLYAPVTLLTLLNLLLANGVGYIFRVAWNRMARRDFFLRRELEHEVAARQRAEDEAHRAEDEAHRANAAKGRFLAVMSHEIRTPLNAVLGGVQLLEETTLRPEQRQPLELVARNGNQLALLLDDVLDLARIEAGRLELVPEPFCPAELLAGVHAALYAQARAKSLTLRGEHGPLPARLVGDGLRLRQVLINLVGNAVKFTQSGEVVLSLELSELADPPGHMRCAFSVRDTGPGLDEEAQARVFAPFEQADMSIHRRFGGAGLGLAISRELVAAMGSELSLESAPGRGCTFHFTLLLPRAEAAPLAAPVVAEGRSLSVLVVDDLEANCIVAAGLLASLGHRARTVADGAAALEALGAERFDAVLLDLHMQDMDGLEVLRCIRSDPRLTGLPVFLSTADTERARVKECMEAGMTQLLPKPIRKARLAALLAGIPAVGAASPTEVTEAVPLVDTAHVAQVIADLGAETWSAGLRACRASAEACLVELEDPARTGRALHRLAGLSASYGLLRLHQRVRHAETLVSGGEVCPLDELRELAATSLDQLEMVGT